MRGLLARPRSAVVALEDGAALVHAMRWTGWDAMGFAL